METDHSTQLLGLVKQLADGVLKLRIAIQDQEARLARLEYVMTTDAVSKTPIPKTSEPYGDCVKTFYAQRDIIE